MHPVDGNWTERFWIKKNKGVIFDVSDLCHICLFGKGHRRVIRRLGSINLKNRQIKHKSSGIKLTQFFNAQFKPAEFGV